LFNALARAELLAYTSLCRPQLEYAAAVWDPSLQYLIKDIEQVQNNAIRFIAKLKGGDSITVAHDKLNLETFTDRRFKLRHNLLLQFPSNEENHASLTNSYDELNNSKTQNARSTRASRRSDPPTIFCKISSLLVLQQLPSKNSPGA